MVTYDVPIRLTQKQRLGEEDETIHAIFLPVEHSEEARAEAKKLIAEKLKIDIDMVGRPRTIYETILYISEPVLVQQYKEAKRLCNQRGYNKKKSTRADDRLIFCRESLKRFARNYLHTGHRGDALRILNIIDEELENIY